MIHVTPFESFRRHRSNVPAELKEDVRVPTLIVEHSNYSELLVAATHSGYSRGCARVAD